MNRLEKLLYERWHVPVEAAYKVDCLSHNLGSLKVTEASLRKLLTDCLTGILSPNYIVGTIDYLMGLQPFKGVRDNRYRIEIYLFSRNNSELLADYPSANKDTIFRERVYWNSYSTKEEALKKWEVKSAAFLEDPVWYGDIYVALFHNYLCGYIVLRNVEEDSLMDIVTWEKEEGLLEKYLNNPEVMRV